MILINCVFKTTCIVNKSSYEKEQLKLHQSLLGVKGGGGQNQPSEQPSLQHLAVFKFSLLAKVKKYNKTMTFYTNFYQNRHQNASRVTHFCEA